MDSKNVMRKHQKILEQEPSPDWLIPQDIWREILCGKILCRPVTSSYVGRPSSPGMLNVEAYDMLEYNLCTDDTGSAAKQWQLLSYQSAS